MGTEKQYLAFISYKHDDKDWAKWLQDKIEFFKLPTFIVEKHPELPKHLRPIFRDETDLELGDLSENIIKALSQSRFLIVICSPRTKKSKYVEEEILTFINLYGIDNVIPFIVEGVPNVDDDSQECLPSCLKPYAENMLAANINELGQDYAAIKVIAKMLNLDIDSLWQRYRIAEDEEKERLLLQRNKLLKVQSYYLSEKSILLLDQGDARTAKLLAVESLPRKEMMDRPYVAEAESALIQAFHSNNMILKNKQQEYSVEKVSSIFIVPENNKVITLAGSYIYIWEISSRKFLRRFGSDFGFFSSASYHSGIIATANPVISERCISLWNIDSGEKLWSVNFSDVNPSIVKYNGDIIAAVCGRRYLFLLTAIDHKIIAKCYVEDDVDAIEITEQGVLFTMSGRGLFLWNPNENTINEINGWNTYGLSFIKDFGDDIIIGCEFGEIRTANHYIDFYPIETPHFSASGDWIALGCSDRKVRLVYRPEGICFKTINVNEEITSVCISGTSLAIGLASGDVRIQTINTNNYLRKIEAKDKWWPDEIIKDWSAIASYKNILVLKSDDHDDNNIQIGLFDLQTKKIIERCNVVGNGICSIAYNGSLLVMGLSNGGICVVDSSDFRKMNYFSQNLTGFSSAIDSISVNNSYIIALSRSEERYTLFNYIENNLVCKKTDTNDIYCVKIIDDYILLGFDAFVAVLDYNLNEVKRLEVIEYDDIGYVCSMAYENGLVAAGCGDKTIRIWDIESGKLKDILVGHNHQVWHIAMDNGRIVSTSNGYDQDIRIWNIETGLCIETIEHEGGPDTICYSGDYIAYNNKLWYLPSYQKIIDEVIESEKENLLSSDERLFYHLD